MLIVIFQLRRYILNTGGKLAPLRMHIIPLLVRRDDFSHPDS